MTEEHIVGWIPALFLPGQILNLLCLAAYGIVLLKISPENERYRTAGICSIVSGGVGTLVELLSGGSEASAWTLVFILPVAIVSLVGTYHEYTGHSEVLSDIDANLSEKWEKLWKWFLWSLLGMLGSVLVMLIAPILGLIVFLVAAVGTIIVSILTLVYLYRTAKVFREYPQNVG